MALSRFPKRKYLRQLYAMEAELQEWRWYFRSAAGAAGSNAKFGRLDDRAAVLEDAAYRVMKAAEMIEGVPRIS